jgi:hypothetical protein
VLRVHVHHDQAVAGCQGHRGPRELSKPCLGDTDVRGCLVDATRDEGVLLLGMDREDPQALLIQGDSPFEY